jgi:integrase
LVRKGYVETNPWTDHDINWQGRSARDKQPERPFTVDEIHALLDGPAEPVMHDIMRMALYSGARIEELALLRVADIDPAERTMAIRAYPKTASSRRIDRLRHARGVQELHSSRWLFPVRVRLL